MLQTLKGRNCIPFASGVKTFTLQLTYHLCDHNHWVDIGEIRNIHSSSYAQQQYHHRHQQGRAHTMFLHGNRAPDFHLGGLLISACIRRAVCNEDQASTLVFFSCCYNGQTKVCFIFGLSPFALWRLLSEI